MFRLCKMAKIFRLLSLGICLAGILITGTGQQCMASEMVSEECKAENPGTPVLCNEDEYILLSTGNNYAEIYDSHGICVGSCRAYLDDTYGAATIKNNTLLDYMDGDTIAVYSMADLKTVLEFPGGEYYIQINGDVCLATNRNTGRVCLYDCHGELLYSSGESTWTEDEYQGRLMVLDHGYLIGSCRVTDAGTLPAIGPVWLSIDGQEKREVTDFYLTEAFANWETQEFGDYILVYNWETETGAVYDLDGKAVLDQIETYLSPYTDDSWFYSYNYNMKTALVFQNVDDMYTVYNTQLQDCAMFPALETERWALGYAAGFIKGASYQQLEGNTCDGFVRYNDKAWYPYAETGEGYLVYADGQQILVPMQEGQDLNSFNERYAMAGFYENGVYLTRLLDRKTGDILMDSCWEENGGISFEIGKDYCIITETNWDGDDCQTSITIHDSENQICYSSDKASARTWKNGYIVMKRGIYHGIADIEGNWIVKTICRAEE